MSLRLALFDCDGTLVDSLAGIVAAMAEAWAARGLGMPEAAAVRRIVGLSLPEAVARLLPGHGPAEHAAVARLYREAYRAHRLAGLHEDPLFPATLDVLSALEAEGFLLGIATGKSMRGLLGVLDRHGIGGRFVTLQTADFCRGKPDPEMVTRALAETGAEATGTVVVGDTVYDIGMARAAGARAVGVAWGYHRPEELTAAGADAIAEGFPAIPALLARLVPPRPVLVPCG